MSAETRSQKVAAALAENSVLFGFIAFVFYTKGEALLGLGFAIAAALIEIRGARRGSIFIRIVIGIAICVPIAAAGKRRSLLFQIDLDASISRHLSNSLELCRAAERVEVFEGLPHQTQETELLEEETRRPDVFSSHDFSFYTPILVLPAVDRERLVTRVLNPKTYEKWQGERACCDFHPDLLLRFHHMNGITDLQLCFGCSEAIFYGPNLKEHVSLEYTAATELEEIQHRNRAKRPQKDQP